MTTGNPKRNETSKPKLDERFITTVEGKEFVKYPGLLDLAHQTGIESIEVQLIQIPNLENENTAICQASVISKSGQKFTDIGDANPMNCNPRVAKHIIRMASTRAIARALRSFTNIGMTCLEELGENDSFNGNNFQKTNRKKSAVFQNANGNGGNGSKPKRLAMMSEAQKRAINNLRNRRNMTLEDLKEMVLQSYGIDLVNLSSSDASSLIQNLQQSA